MSGFIVRDYLSPARSIQANKIAIKNLYKQVAGTTTIGSTPVINSRIYFYGTYFTAIRDGIRDDKKFNKLFTRLGLTHKKMLNSNYDKVQNVYFYLNTSKLTFQPQTKSFLAEKFYTEYYNAPTTNDPLKVNKDREYIDVKIIIGGDYRNKIYADNAELTLQAADLPALRANVEANIMSYVIGGDKATSNVPMRYTSTGTLYSPTVGITYNPTIGSMYDVLALLDDGSVYECVNECMNEVFSVKELSNGASANGRNIYSNSNTYINLEYSYVKRYKLKRTASSTDFIISQLKDMSDNYHANLNVSSSPFISEIIAAVVKSTSNDLFTKIILALNDTGAESSDFIDGNLKLSSYEALTATEITTLLGKCLDTGYTEKSHSWWETALSIVIVIIAIVIAVAIFILSNGTAANASTATIALAVTYAAVGAAIFLTVAGAIYAKNVGDPTGMRIIAGAAQVAGLTASIAGIYSIYLAPAANAWITTERTLMASLLTINVADTIGILHLDDTTKLYLQIATAALAIEMAGHDLFTNNGSFATAEDSLLQSTMKNVAGYLNLAANGLKIYALSEMLGQHTDTSVQDAQATPEDGVSNIYMLQERTVSYDALENLERQNTVMYGVNNTDMIINRSIL